MTTDADGMLMKAREAVLKGCVDEARVLVGQLLRLHIGYEPALEFLNELEQSATASTEWAVGGVVAGRWEVFGEARGGMSNVYFVRDRQWDEMEMAAKSVRFTALGKDELHAKELFRREQQVWLDLGSHPNIVSGFYTLEISGVLHFFMEYVPGRTLEARVMDGPLPLNEVLDMGIQLATALEYIHERGVVHRDVKPANCIIMDDGTLRLTDFGLSKYWQIHDEVSERREIRDGDQLSQVGAGTPAYMAPEQWRSLSSAGSAADVYALGITLHQLAAGIVPFGSTREAWAELRDLSPGLLALVRAPAPIPEVVLRRLHGEAVPPPLQLPHDIASIVQSCLTKLPDGRPSASEVRRLLIEAYERNVSAYVRRSSGALVASESGENNRAVSYAVMGEKLKACEILDEILDRHPTALYPYINRARLGLHDCSLEPSAVAERFARQVLPAHPGLESSSNVREFSEELRPYLLAHPVGVIAAGADCEILASLDASGEVRSWSRRGEATLLGRFAEATCLSVVRQRILVGSCEQISILAGGAISSLSLPAPPSALAASGDGAVIGDVEGGVTYWDGGQGAQSVRGVRGPIRSVAGCTTGLIAACSIESGVRVWHLGQPRAPICSDHKPALSCIVRGDWKVIIVGGADGVVRIWNLVTKVLIMRLVGHTAGVTGLAMATDGRLITSSLDHSVRVWNVQDGSELRRYDIHFGPVRALVIESNRWIVSASDDGTLRRIPFKRKLSEPQLIAHKDLPVLARRDRDRARNDLLSRLSNGDESAYSVLADMRGRYPELHRDAELAAAEHAARSACGRPTGVARVSIVWSRRLGLRAAHLSASTTGDIAAAASNGDITVVDPKGEVRCQLRMKEITALAWLEGNVVVSDRDSDIQCITPSGALVWSMRWSRSGEVNAMSSDSHNLVIAGWMGRGLRSSGRVSLYANRSSQELLRSGERVEALAVARGEIACTTSGGHMHLFDRARGWRRLNEPRAEKWFADATTLSFLENQILVVAPTLGWSVWAEGGLLVRTCYASPLCDAAVLGNDAIVTTAMDGVIRLSTPMGVMQFERPAHLGPARLAVWRNTTHFVTAGVDGMMNGWRVDYNWT